MPEQDPAEIIDAAELATSQLGTRLLKARKDAGLTLDALARASGVSKGTLSQIEQNKANPSITVLYRVAMALSVPISALVEDPARATHFEVVPAGEPSRKFFTNQACSGHLLNPPWMDRDLECYELNFPVGGQLESQPHHPHTRELLTVVQGNVCVEAGGKQADLGPGDTAHYSADLPHIIKNIGEQEATVYLVVTYWTES
ncbi:MAG: XRE family transcriptional regulator [Phycisphaeraceae bacterium]|nr:XRE family transcriptional regulator [Phycisphaeraceae bacterium]